MPALAHGLHYVDIEFQGAPSVIATVIVDGGGQVALLDPGPATCIETLRARLQTQGIGARDLTAILLTHIHLDHAGATGLLVEENPEIAVYVHERGAPHLVDPRRLLESASRLYGDAMDRLWGPFRAVPAANVMCLAGGDRVEVGGRRLEVAYTPGHASHHVSYFDAASGIAFVGDVAGVRLGAGQPIVAPTPPPDFNLELWTESVGRILDWRPDSLFLTHFGPSTPPAPHLQTLLERLRHFADLAKAILEAGGTEREQAGQFRDQVQAELRRETKDRDVRYYDLAVPLEHCYLGLARYLRRS